MTADHGHGVRSALPRPGDPKRGAQSKSGAGLLGIGVAIGLAALIAAWGCSPKKILLPNLPPDTRVFIHGAVDTVSHRVHLYWFGTDQDGEVVAYRFRFVYPPPASQDPQWDTLTCTKLGRCTDQLFTVQTGDSGVVSPRFEIAAIDDDGALDPSPAVQTFLLSNIAPTVQITTAIGPADTTYASVTVNWNVTDPDGGGPGLHYRVWLIPLPGNEARYDSTSERRFTVPSDRFLNQVTGKF